MISRVSSQDNSKTCKKFTLRRVRCQSIPPCAVTTQRCFWDLLCPCMHSEQEDYTSAALLSKSNSTKIVYKHWALIQIEQDKPRPLLNTTKHHPRLAKSPPNNDLNSTDYHPSSLTTIDIRHFPPSSLLFIIITHHQSSRITNYILSLHEYQTPLFAWFFDSY